ncbi:hypothetical protein NDU88_007616, partial [Pleurodeles waltl]
LLGSQGPLSFLTPLLQDAVHGEAVRTLAPDQWAVVPGTLQPGQQPLKAHPQMPQFSSLATHRQDATPCHSLIFTFSGTPASSVSRE